MKHNSIHIAQDYEVQGTYAPMHKGTHAHRTQASQQASNQSSLSTLLWFHCKSLAQLPARSGTKPAASPWSDRLVSEPPIHVSCLKAEQVQAIHPTLLLAT